MSIIWTISCDNSETVLDSMSVLITNRKLHTGFRLICTTLMTLNDHVLRKGPYLAFLSPNSIALLANYVTVVEDRPRPITFEKYCLPVPVFHFWPKLTHRAARSLCDSCATCYNRIWAMRMMISQIFSESAISAIGKYSHRPCLYCLFTLFRLSEGPAKVVTFPLEAATHISK